MNIIALHGFLGLRSDWDALRHRLPENVHLQARSLWKDLRLISSRFQSKTGTDLGSLFSPLTDLAFELWAQQLIKETEIKVQAGAERPILLGYSLGGRLAMHALLARPELFSGAILVSANPGLPAPERDQGEARLRRFQSDQLWSERFLNQPWNQVVREWNAQPVLAPPPSASSGSGHLSALERREVDFDRLLLADALTSWSLARQKDLHSSRLATPTLLVTGEFDSKFTQTTKSWCRDLGAGEVSHIVIPDAGHRVPWDQPSAFADAVCQWLVSHDWLA